MLHVDKMKAYLSGFIRAKDDELLMLKKVRAAAMKRLKDLNAARTVERHLIKEKMLCTK